MILGHCTKKIKRSKGINLHSLNKANFAASVMAFLKRDSYKAIPKFFKFVVFIIKVRIILL